MCAGVNKDGSKCRLAKPDGIGFNVKKSLAPITWFCRWHKAQAGAS